MRGLALIAALTTAGSALASFDLLLVADSANNVVHRYDGDTGTYLGNFGSGLMTSIRAVAVDKNTKTAYVLQQGGYTAWDYNTGAFKRYVDIFGTAATDLSVTSTGDLLGTFPTSPSVRARRVSNPLGTVAPFDYTTPASFPGATSTVQGNNGNIYVYDGITGNWAIYNPNNSTATSTGNTPSFAGTTKGDSDGTAYLALLANGTVRRTTLGTVSSMTGFAPPTPFTSSVEFSLGHPGQGWGLGINASGTRLQKYMRSGGGVGNFWDPVGSGRTLSQVGTPVGIAVVTAPEPGTLLALGAGAVALLRRRRRA